VERFAAEVFPALDLAALEQKGPAQ
jgi:hypothetical protein